MQTVNVEAEPASWQKIVARYARPDLKTAIVQIVTSVIPYLALFYLAMKSVAVSLWLTVPLCILAAGFLTRTFIIFHDCGHGSYFKSQQANDWIGTITGLMTFTCYRRWKHEHAIHHATAGDLDRRGTGDVYTMTLEEYRAAPWYVKVGYRLMRYPGTMFLIGAPFMFLLMERLPLTKGQRERNSVWWTNVGLILLVAAMGLTFGWRAYLIVQLVTLYLGSIVGVWLFYVQHNFEGVYWRRHEQWEYLRASLEGSSFYQLPGLLRWFSGNIGFHHIHHLASKIPSYNLEKAYRENPELHVKPLTLRASLKSLTLRVYDEASGQLTGFSGLRKQTA